MTPVPLFGGMYCMTLNNNLLIANMSCVLHFYNWHHIIGFYMGSTNPDLFYGYHFIAVKGDLLSYITKKMADMVWEEVQWGTNTFPVVYKILEIPPVTKS